uniref:Integrin beta-like protein 1 n=1 Tax=Oreochromis niloticus TaxID=8128 RepID=A0A669EGN7_ORENI
MHTEVLVQSMLVPLFLILLSFIEDSLLQSVSQVGGVCKLSTESSLRRCRTPDGKICSGRGKCNCGICICEAIEPGKFFGPRCECHDWVCATYNGKTCNDRGYCDCGVCECDESWFGDACQFQEECTLSGKESRELCKNQQGVVCSNRGTCHCGSCMCDNEDKRGMVTGRFCECDDSECLDEETGEICGGHGQCYCGNCYCAAGWHGDKCEFQCDMSPWESRQRCTSPDGKICSNRGQCQCGQCTCHPPGDSRVHGKNCECDDRQCEDISGEVCGGHGYCSCGRCICEKGWFGKLCQFPRSCDMSDAQSKGLCETSDGVICSGKGSCHCGKCICNPQDWWVSGEYCECDDRECDKHDGIICTGNGLCNCGNCECWDGWNGNACEIWVGEEY